MLHQLGWKAQTDEARLLRYALALAPEKDFFIRKATGWALRDRGRARLFVAACAAPVGLDAPRGRKTPGLIGCSLSLAIAGADCQTTKPTYKPDFPTAIIGGASKGSGSAHQAKNLNDNNGSVEVSGREMRDLITRTALRNPLLAFRSYFRKSSPKREQTFRCMIHWAIVQTN